MKRPYLFCLAIMASCLAHAGVISLVDVDYQMDTVACYQAGPGSEYIKVKMHRLSDGKNPQEVYFLKVDTKNPNVAVRSVMGKDLRVGLELPSAMASRKTTDTEIYFAGINGDFYSNSAPVGYTITDNEYVYTPLNTNRRVGAVGEDSRGMIATQPQFVGEIVTAGGDTVVIDHVNAGRNTNELVLYNHYEGSTTGTNGYGLELLCELPEGEEWHTTGCFHPVVKKVESRIGSMVMGAHEFVLSAHGTKETMLQGVAVNDVLTMNMSLLLDDSIFTAGACIAGDNYALIVQNGELVKSNFWNEVHPRTGFGYSQNNDTAIFCIWDGRNSKVSAGANTQQLGCMMQYFGAWNAVNWDGGGSSCMYIRHEGQVNNGADGEERVVTNGMFAVAVLPEADTTYATLVPYENQITVAHYGIATPKCRGYNQYGVMLSSDVEGMEINCDAQVGRLYGDRQVIGLSSGVLTLRKGNAVTTIQMNVSNSPMALIRDSVLLGRGTQYEAKIQAKVGEEMMDAYLPAFTWLSESEQVATVDKGVITGVGTGRTHVICSVDQFRDTMEVIVEVPEQPTMVLQDAVADTMVSYSSTRTATIALNWDLRLYGIPDSIAITIQTDAPIASLETNMLTSAGETISYKSAITVPVNEDYTTTMALTSVLKSADCTLYPVHLTGLKWALKDPIKNKAYRFQLKQVKLIYLHTAQTGWSGVYSNRKTPTTKYLKNGRVVIEHQGKVYEAKGDRL